MEVLLKLEQVLKERKEKLPEKSYTANLFRDGEAHLTQIVNSARSYFQQTSNIYFDDFKDNNSYWYNYHSTSYNYPEVCVLGPRVGIAENSFGIEKEMFNNSIFKRMKGND